jgi:hypothetical protein
MHDAAKQPIVSLGAEAGTPPVEANAATGPSPANGILASKRSNEERLQISAPRLEGKAKLSGFPRAAMECFRESMKPLSLNSRLVSNIS